MPTEQEPVVNTETVSAPVNESQVVESTTPTVTVPEVVEQVPVPNPELETLRKELNQAKMRANQLENASKEAARLKLEEANEYQKLYEDSQAEIKARDEKDERDTAAKEARTIRDSAIDAYPDKAISAAAKKLVAQNDSYFYWGNDAATEADAQAQVRAQLDIFAETFGTPAPVVPAVKNAVIDANNPLEGRDSVAAEEQAALRERLGNVTF